MRFIEQDLILTTTQWLQYDRQRRKARHKRKKTRRRSTETVKDN